MRVSARLYNCTRCQQLVIICRSCDFGNVYCAMGCAKAARAEGQRRASHKYRSSRRGRMNNADRQRRFRERQRKKVTQQGSAVVDDNALLVTELKPLMPVGAPVVERTRTTMVCHFCWQLCDDFLRRHFLDPPMRRRRRHSP